MCQRCSRRTWLSLVASAQASSASMGLSAWGIEPARTWPYEVQAGVFRIHADFEITATSSLIGQLKQLIDEARELLRLPEPTQTTHMVLFERSEEYRRYMDHYFPKLPARRALFIQQRGTGMLFAHRHAEMELDLRHEALHALVNQHTRNLPLWLDEGLAEYFEVEPEQRWRGHNHLLALQLLSVEDVPNLDQLEQLEDFAAMTGQRYRDCWSWVHFLLHRRQSTRQLLIDQLSARRSGTPIAPLSRSLANQLRSPESEFLEHFRALRS